MILALNIDSFFKSQDHFIEFSFVKKFHFNKLIKVVEFLRFYKKSN